MARYSVTIGPGPADEVARAAARAESAGFEAVWTSEMFHDPFLPLAAAATNTSRIGLGTSIALAFVRSPWVTALSALDLDVLSGGRFILGLGTGLKRLNERWHGVAYGKPTPHIREAVQVIRLITERAHGGEPIRFSGQYYDVDIQGWRRPQAPVRDRIPIYLAGVREGMIRTAAAVADGLLGHPIYSLRWIRDVVLPSLARGLAESSRTRHDFHLCLAVCCAVGKDSAAARRAAAATIAFYATVNTYEPLFAPFAAQVGLIQAALLRGDTDSMVSAVTDDMIDAFAVVGTPDEARKRLAAYVELADSICLSPPDQLINPGETEAYREALLATFAG
ncbi:MAG TPA: LLM class flavin-dependent oxidoreductase [Dehalococcoidia bacterium]|nr:LLM class flavin-dependent oxidoreductase [Dehalococcoidia bacterium]